MIGQISRCHIGATVRSLSARNRLIAKTPNSCPETQRQKYPEPPQDQSQVMTGTAQGHIHLIAEAAETSITRISARLALRAGDINITRQAFADITPVHQQIYDCCQQNNSTSTDGEYDQKQGLCHRNLPLVSLIGKT